jgi:hypothetical protein
MIVEQTFAIISGSPTLTRDASKFYYEQKTHKLTSTASAGVIELFNGTAGLATASSAKNSLSFFVYPAAGVTSVITNFRYNNTDSKVTHTVTPETWNLVTRTFTNPATLTSFSLRLETVSGSQTIWFDGEALCKGADSMVRFAQTSSGSSWFGKDVDDAATNQLVFDLQNVLTFRDSLSSSTIASHYREFNGGSSATLAAAGSGVNLVPSTGTSVSDPSDIYNRSIQIPELLFTENPIFLSGDWQILSAS